MIWVLRVFKIGRLNHDWIHAGDNTPPTFAHRILGTYSVLEDGDGVGANS